MVFRRTSKGKKRAPRRKIMRKRRAPRAKRAGGNTDYAKCVEIVEQKMAAISDGAGGATGICVDFCLQDYARPQEIAHAYKYYRAAKVEMTFIPYFNIAQTGGAGQTQLPQLYMAVDRLGNRYIDPTEDECLERGITPRLFNRKQRLSFKPNLLQGISLETRQPADGGGVPMGIDLAGYQNCVPLYNKWLPTQQSFGYNVAPPNNQVNQVLAPTGVNPYALKYYGAIYVAAIEGQPIGEVIVGDLQVKITWEFKGPRALKTNPPAAESNPYAVTSSQGNPGAVPNTQPTTYP